MDEKTVFNHSMTLSKWELFKQSHLYKFDCKKPMSNISLDFTDNR